MVRWLRARGPYTRGFVAGLDVAFAYVDEAYERGRAEAQRFGTPRGRPTIDDVFAADTAAYRRGQADAFDLDADGVDQIAEELPEWIDEYGLEEVCARLRLVAGHSRAYADQVRASAPR